MTDQTIRIGIDLGTTNSSIAVSTKGEIEIIKNPDRSEYTPSVFGIDKAGNKVVGERAYARLFQFANKEDVKNFKAEVKREMGTSEGYYFERIKQTLTPEEISAEILKYLKDSVVNVHSDFPTTAAVITIPAYFSTLEAEATKRAGNLAGFEYVVLLQEPIAAAMAYGFTNSGNSSWLVYDLGGGTFDVALVSSKDGVLSVKGHSGNNFLGGKDIDKLIVNNIILPEIESNYNLPDFNENNEKFAYLFPRLKYLAEKAKKDLSQDQKTLIEVENIGEDDDGKEISISIDFTRKELEKLVEPLIQQTITLAKETIKNSGIKASSVDKIILVGGPTQMPYIRNRLKEELKIDVDTTVDPLTVVAKGACIYGASQRIPKEHLKEVKTDKKAKEIKLNYESMSTENEEIVTGFIEDLKGSKDNYYIQIQSDSGSYSSQRIKLKDGKFFETLALEKKKSNLFWIYLFDEKGNPVNINPDSFTIMHGLSVSGAPIPHSIGVSVAEIDAQSGMALKNTFEPFFEKDSILPLKETRTYHTAKRLNKEDKENELPIKVYEGESKTPENNIFICKVAIKGQDLPHDLPERTQVDITIEVNESREVTVEAYIPSIELTLPARGSILDEDVDTKNLEAELAAQKSKYNRMSEDLSSSEKDDLENLLGSIESSLSNAETSNDERRKANKELKDFKNKMESLEHDKEMPQLTKDFNQKVQAIQEIQKNLENQSENEKVSKQLDLLTSEGNRAIEKSDKHLLSQVNGQLETLFFSAIFSIPATWVYQFEKLSNGNYNFTNKNDADYYIDKGKRAISLNDVEELKRCVANLMRLLPPEEQQAISSSISGITR